MWVESKPYSNQNILVSLVVIGYIMIVINFNDVIVYEAHKSGKANS